VKFTTDQLEAINHSKGDLQLIPCAGFRQDGSRGTSEWPRSWRNRCSRSCTILNKSERKLVEYQLLQLITSLMTPMLILMGMTLAWLYFQRLGMRQEKQDEFNRLITERDLRLREEAQATERKRRSDDATTGRAEPDAGFAFFDIDEQYKSLFCDAMQGFGEYAKLKGYNITFVLDASLPGKVGVRFVIMDSGVTVSTATVKKDVDEYISKSVTATITEPPRYEKRAGT
jgi:hypothetical protein